MKYIHVTQNNNLKSILKNGLIPQIGKYAKEMKECEPSIWLFPTLEDAKEMVPIWLIPSYGDNLVFLEISLPDDFPINYTGSDYEITVTRPIPPKWIKIL